MKLVFLFLEIVEQSEDCRTGKKICEELARCIKKHDVSVSILKKIYKEQEKVSTLCACVLNTSEPNSDLADLQKDILDCISELWRIEQDCSRNVQLLESAIELGKKLSSDISYPVRGIKAIIGMFSDLKKTMDTRKVYELQDDTFWGELLPFLEPAKALEPLVKSVSFISLAKNLSNFTSNVEGHRGTAVSDFYSLMKFLTTTSIEELQLQWNPVFDDAGKLTVETMKTLLGPLKDERRLDEELEILAEYFNRPFSPSAKTYIHDFVQYSDILEQVQHVIGILKTFKLADSPNPSIIVLLQFQALEDSATLTLVDLHQSVEAVQQILSSFSREGLGCIMEELSRSGELLDFIEEIVGEDIRFLIDGVEEYSDQFVNESSVSGLIDVHGFLAPLIEKKNENRCDPKDFLKMLEESCLSHKDIAVKIQQCNTNVNSLRELYLNIANRGEVTKEIIGNCLSKGEYWVSQKDGKCKTEMIYVRQEGGEHIYTLSDLHDLRSRAHLIVSSRKNAIKMQCSHSYEVSEDIDYDTFINQVNLLTEISTVLSKLCSSGYVKYREFWQRMKTTDDLQSIKDRLHNDLESWENILRDARGIFYFLNFYYSDQLCMLYEFLINESKIVCDDLLSLIHFIDRTITKQQLQQHQHSLNKLKTLDSQNSPELMVSVVGEALQNIFSNFQRVVRPISDSNDQSLSLSKMEATVSPGKIFIASLEPESLLTSNVILTLYENTSNAYPDPHQIVFCSSQTTWEELHLLLQRCFAHSRHFHNESLFCIANVELLPNELQFTLVDAIKERQKSHQSSEAVEENANYLLALVCRGGDHHHVVAQFAQYSHHIAGMSDHALGDRLKAGWPNVKMITSSLPGLGKTEQIKCEALEKSMNVVTFSISGPFKPCKVIQRLKDLKLKTYNCLHLDIGEVSDPLLLDTFLFQLIITGMVSAVNQFYHLPTKHIYIEIANTLKDWLRDSLVVSKYFTRVHLNWQNYRDLLVSSKITSSVQVVCQYLDIFDRGCIETKEIIFSGSKSPKPVSTLRCQELLAKYFSSDADTTFSTLHAFLNLLADQLLKFSKSTFFMIESLASMVGEEAQDVRKNLFHALLEVSKEFASRSLTTCHASDTQNLSWNKSANATGREKSSAARSAQNMVERVKGMIQWEDNNHLLVVFQALDAQAITAMYRNKSLVPSNVKKVLQSQCVTENRELDDFNNFTQEQLQDKLEKTACIKVVEKSSLFPSYALTPDSVLKMILIILRVRVNAPVIIMGETGCGKTSLVRYLANTCGVQFHKFDLHAGISEDKIIAFIKEKESHVKDVNTQIWIFLDEINTCDHLGLISDIVCHHSLLGQPLSKNLVFLAACNPYQIRSEEHIKTAGLDGKDITDECSRLVYRVHPLPEAMIDYVWDYGSLSPKDERNYIQRMVESLPEMYEVMVDLLAASQTFIRNAENNHFCVSLRDVHRCIRLVCWFLEMMKNRKKSSCIKGKCPIHLMEYRRVAEKYNDKPMVKSIVLALALCYLTRLQTEELRKKYRECMVDLLFSSKGMTNDENVDSFAAILRMEEEDYLDRMELPRGTARNAALRENVFVMLVCILNRIPIFVVGKPGCSKSLSIQLIRSNLRGRDSRDPLFRELPQLYFVSYQGSESSTSEGIVKVFEKAGKYKSHSCDGNILPVVLLDEVGLAENSKYNPLKVLHSLLEPGEGKNPDVAVVGISNWSLDAAKMNRAIHLSRPEPTIEDLCETGCSLHYADTDELSQYLRKEELECLTEGYFEYQSQQSHPNFHGLRDYYSMIKSLTGRCSFKHVNISLQRNFGGLPGEVTKIQGIFLSKLKKLMITSDEDVIPVTELIQANFLDPYARHLMLITSGDSAIGILKQSLAKLEKETITIYGSRFEEDLSEDYNYRILSRIILCMERDCILILKDLESVYGSLYDMLNQNYAVVGNRKNCRVALGAYSNPMCQVHDGFRCIVLTDQDKVNNSEPPFLNRFEKQVLRFTDVLTEIQLDVITKLDKWVQEMSTGEDLEQHFREIDMFIGFHQDTLPSLVFSHGHDTDVPAEEVLRKCKDDLMWIASPDGVLRTQNCKLLEQNSQEVKELSDEYFKKPLHQGIAAFMEHVVREQQSFLFGSDNIGSKTVVMTFSNIHTDIYRCLGHRFNCQVERLSAYKSEKQLADKIGEFWNVPDKELLVLQCKPDLDGIHVLLARSIIEEKRNSYKQCLSEMNTQRICKHVCIVVHVQRGQDKDGVSWQLSFLCGWRQVFLDILEAPFVPLNQIVGKSVHKLLTSSVWPISSVARNDLLWCFTCIKDIQNQRPLDSVLHIAKNLFSSQRVLQAIETLILHSTAQDAVAQDREAYRKENWQVKVACDRQLLVNSSTLNCAMEQFVTRLVRRPLAKIVYFVEKENSWPPHLLDVPDVTLSEKLEHIWCTFIVHDTVFKISDMPEPRGAGSYVCDRTSLDLCFPFSQVIYRNVNRVKELFLDDYARLVEIEDNLDENGQLQQIIRQDQHEKFCKMIRNLVPATNCHTSDICEAYMKDVFDIFTADFSRMLCRSQRVLISQALFVTEVKQSLPVRDFPEFCEVLHAFVWVHREEVLDVLRMVDRCQPFIQLDVLFDVVNTSFDKPQEVMLIFNEEDVDIVKESQKTEEATDNHANSLPVKALNPQIESEEKQIGITAKHSNFDFEFRFQKPVPNFESDEEEAEKQIEDHENLERLGEMLVMSYCEEMLPSQEVVERNGGLESWIRNTSMLLSLAFKVSITSPAFHYLRLCLDFSRIVFTSAALSTRLSSLYILDEIGKSLAPHYLDHERSFEMVTNQVIKPLEEDMEDQEDKQKSLQKFSALFYGRCIDTNVDINARPIIERFFSLERPELVMMMSPVILRLLMVEQADSNSPEIFKEIIVNPVVIENCSCLQIIDEVFKENFTKAFIHHDSYHAVVICDLIQSLPEFTSHIKIDDVNSPDCELLFIAKSASKVMSQNSKDYLGLHLLSAVAFLRAFFAMFAEFVSRNPSILSEDSPYIHLMAEVTSLIKESRSPLQIFFMKQLYKNAGLFDLQKWFAKKNILPTVGKLLCDGQNQYKAVFTCVLNYPEYEQARSAFWRLEENDESFMVEFLRKCNISSNHGFALLGMLINMVYLKRAVRKLNDTEERVLNWFVDKIASLPSLFQQLLLRVIGRRDFQCPQLQLSPESSVKEVEMALLVLHISCVVATGTQSENLPIYCYFTNPAKFTNPSVLAHCQDDVRSVFEYQLNVKESACVTCACGLRLALKSDANEKVCPYCHEVLKNNEATSRTSSETIGTLLTMFSDERNSEWNLCTKHMSPAVYRALRLVVYSSYYAGLAIETSSEEDLSTAMGGFDLDDGSTTLERLCFAKMENDLACLMKILSCKRNVAIKTMHLLIEKSSELIGSSNLLEGNDCSTQEMRREWEAIFNELVKTVCLKERETSIEIKENMKLQQEENIHESTLECSILELDPYPHEQEKQNHQLKRLFRLTKQPNFEDFRSAFLHASKDVQVKHSFLMLFFATYDKLSLIGNLHHLLKWSRVLSSALTHRISRKDAQSKPINDFIYGHLFEKKRSPQEIQYLKELFDNFKEAWNEMRPLVNQTLVDEEQKMPRLSETACVAYCLTESDCGIHLQTAIEILISMQNAVLDAAVSLSSHRHPALAFLEKENCSGVVSSIIQDVKETEIIRFQWSYYSNDLFQRHSQNSPEYGRGEEITYDFERIEIELAREIAFGKCHLTGTLNQFVFAKELFHSCGSLLTEIRSLVKQSATLPEEVCKGLSNLKERGKIKEAQDLLQQIEVLIYLLKRKLKHFDVNITLEELAEEWSPMLPSPFPVKLLPEPRDAIKIKHIVALYEALEDVLVDGAIDGLADQFRRQLPVDLKKIISDMGEKRVDQLTPQSFLKALRRFVFRYLSSETERNWPEEHTALQTCLKEASLWSPLQPPCLDEIPQDITLEYIHSIIRYHEETEKVSCNGLKYISHEIVETQIVDFFKSCVDYNIDVGCKI